MRKKEREIKSSSFKSSTALKKKKTYFLEGGWEEKGKRRKKKNLRNIFFFRSKSFGVNDGNTSKLDFGTMKEKNIQFFLMT